MRIFARGADAEEGMASCEHCTIRRLSTLRQPINHQTERTVGRFRRGTPMLLEACPPSPPGTSWKRECKREVQFLFARIVVMDAGIGDVRHAHAEARAVVELVGDPERRAELEHAAEIAAVAFGIATGAEQWREYDVADGDVGVDAA
jgi:hypothetical protein